jgi:hypothetical protein
VGKVLSRTGVLGPLQLIIDADTQQSWGRSFMFSLAGPTVSRIDETRSTIDDKGWGGALLMNVPGLSMLPEEREWLLNLVGL